MTTLTEARNLTLRTLLGLALLLPAGLVMASEVVVFKSRTCGCCQAWIEHLEANGFKVSAHDSERMTEVKDFYDVPQALRSCHTAEVEGYLIEGHVPAREVRRLLSERPETRGLSVPGMPIGSPGMEQGDRREAYDVLRFDKDGKVSVFASY